jgi:alpha 1,3-glucosidase
MRGKRLDSNRFFLISHHHHHYSDIMHGVAKQMSMLRCLQLGLLAAVCLLSIVSAVRQGDFKKCENSSFCRRIRRLSSYVESESTTSKPFKSPYYISPKSTSFNEKEATLTALVKSVLHPEIDFELQVLFYNDGTSRLKLDQIGQRHGGWKRFDGAASWAIDEQPVPAPTGEVVVEQTDKETKVK